MSIEISFLPYHDTSRMYLPAGTSRLYNNGDVENWPKSIEKYRVESGRPELNDNPRIRYYHLPVTTIERLLGDGTLVHNINMWFKAVTLHAIYINKLTPKKIVETYGLGGNANFPDKLPRISWALNTTVGVRWTRIKHRQLLAELIELPPAEEVVAA